jgi:Anti-sigma factor NepR
MSGKKDSTPYNVTEAVADARGPARSETRDEPRAGPRGDPRGHGHSAGHSGGHASGPSGARAAQASLVAARRLQLVRNDRYREASTRTGPPSQRAGKRTVMLDRSLQERIGAILRESFADIEQEPLPERLSKLIEALHREEKRR